MHRNEWRAPGRAFSLALSFFWMGAVVGCGSSGPNDGDGITLKPPATWKPVAATQYQAPGTPLSAWSGPRGSSLVLYRTMPAPGLGPQSLAEEMANRLTNLPGLRVISRGVERVAGRDAGRVEALAPGMGDAFAPSGMGKAVSPDGRALVPTRRVCLAFPDEARTLWLIWHYPESAHAEIAPQIAETLKDLRIAAGSAVRSSHY